VNPGTSSSRRFLRALFKPVLTCFAVALGAIHAFGADPNNVTNIFKTHSTPARSIADYSVLVIAICAVIFVVVAGLLVYTAVRFRHRPGDEQREPAQIYGSNQIELAWTVLPILIVVVLALVTARTIADIQNAEPTSKAVRATIVGHQWWWEIRYPGLGIVTANELHVPVSDPNNPTPTFLTLESVDVAHSFWVPDLAGKTDVIPNRENSMWIEPLQTGAYPGNCAEYCGTQHARMLIRVVVDTPEDFQTWVAAQQRDAQNDPQVATGVNTGMETFLSTSCVNCHTVKGTQAKGKFGPDLTHLMSRATLGAGAAQNTPENLRAWVRNPQGLKPGCYMPDMQLTDDGVDQIVSYLRSLN
jgi:cytochrome c oxidase subunit 2